MASSSLSSTSARGSRTEPVRKVSESDGGGGGVQSIPLVPHRAQHRRLLAEMSAMEAATFSRYYLNLTSNEDRPRQYPRRKLAMKGERQNPQEHRRQQQQVVSLYQGLGTHYADLWCGTPPQRQTVIVDTGSATTAFACSGCSPRRCGRLDRYHIDPPFKEFQSASFRKLPCTDCFLGECVEESNECSFGVSYQEGSNWTAYEAIDTCYVGGMHRHPITAPSHAGGVSNNSNNKRQDGLDPHRAATDYSFDLRFGCQTQMTGHFRTQLADGIMGMDIGKPAIWNQMFLQGTIASRAFSLCFTREEDARRSGTEAGAMTFGGTDTRLHSIDMVYSATNLDGAGFFSVQLHKIYLRHGGLDDDSILATDYGNVVPLHISESLMNAGQIIIDSGTTDSYFVHQYVVKLGDVIGRTHAYKVLTLFWLLVITLLISL
jgi:hypothetical protein